MFGICDLGVHSWHPLISHFVICLDLSFNFFKLAAGCIFTFIQMNAHKVEITKWMMLFFFVSEVDIY
jgi:hypothetical protein